MNKKIFSISLIILLYSLLFISCNNKDKTGSTNDISNYQGTWNFDSTPGAHLTINADGSCGMNSLVNIKNTVTKKSDNTYNIVFEIYSDPENKLQAIINVDVTFNTSTTGTVKGTQKDYSPDGTSSKETPINDTITKQ